MKALVSAVEGTLVSKPSYYPHHPLSIATISIPSAMKAFALLAIAPLLRLALAADPTPFWCAPDYHMVDPKCRGWRAKGCVSDSTGLSSPEWRGS